MLAIVFLLFVVLSFVGSLQPGPVNIGVVYYALLGQKKPAILLALGGSLPEVLYTAIAIKSLVFSKQMDQYLSVFSATASVVFVVLGVYIIFAKSAQQKVENFGGKGAFWLGLSLGSLNPQLILFWAGIAWYIHLNFESLKLLENINLILASLGAGFGAFLLHIFYFGLIQKYEQAKVLKWIKEYPQKVIGTIYFLMGVLGIFHTCFNF